ncbi:LysR family transcriptional regulator [Rhizobium giardinii]|uniref:HTH-type transcriptional regulator TtuA n=1 Tax=Rhizobium giardinii TaxID=56731 RepID=A0A7W8UB59_9HYPH|nr:LysR family transcriptional regulator [Rhizobium giardinii]MBB5536176.1 LysR family nitrogen assimilation transcriptional regulator [Rhizobium giardinii]
MDVRQLKYLIAIAEKRSIAAAAEALGMAQPSLSVQMKNLEHRLGTELFVRSPRGVTLNEAGEILLLHAGQILHAVEVATNEVREAGRNPSGPVIFGFPSSASMVLSVPLAETIRLEYPDIRLRAVDAMSGFIKEWLEEETIDLALLYETSGLVNAEVKTLLHENLYFYAAPDLWPFDSSLAQPVTLSSIQNIELVLPSKSHGLRMLIDQHCKQAGVTLNIVVEMDSLSQIKSLVSRGSACTILAPAAANDSETRGELIGAPLVDPVISRPVYLVRNPKRMRTKASAVVEKATIDVVRELVERNIWRGTLDTGALLEG